MTESLFSDQSDGDSVSPRTSPKKRSASGLAGSHETTFVAAGSFELAMLLTNGMLVRPLGRSNDESSTGWSLALHSRSDMPVVTSRVTPESKMDCRVAFEIDSDLMPAVKMPCVVPLGSVKSVVFESEERLQSIRRSFRPMSLPVDLLQLRVDDSLFGDAVLGSSGELETNQDDDLDWGGVTRADVIRGLSYGGAIRAANVIGGRLMDPPGFFNAVQQLYPGCTIDGQPPNSIRSCFDALVDRDVLVEENLSSAFAAVIEGLDGSVDPGAELIFEHFGRNVSALESDAGFDQYLEYLQGIVNGSKRIVPSDLKDTEDDPLKRSIALLLMDPDFSRMVKYFAIPHDQRPGRHVLFGALVLSAMLKAGRSFNGEFALGVSGRPIEDYHSLLTARMFASICGRDDERVFYEGLLPVVESVREELDGVIRHRLVGTIRTARPRNIILCEHLEKVRAASKPSIHPVLLDLASHLEKTDEVASCDFVAPCALGIRLCEKRSDHLKMIECFFEEGERSTVRFECSLDLVGMVGKKRQSLDFIASMFKGEPLSASYRLIMDGPKSRPLTAVAFTASCDAEVSFMVFEAHLRSLLESARTISDRILGVSVQDSVSENKDLPVEGAAADSESDS